MGFGMGLLVEGWALTMLGDALGDADDEGDLGGNGLLDTGGGHRGAVVVLVSTS